ncbi:MAG: 9-O-acetylesterase, partial [Planctomycetes bacterium]|nr:9-O-acetylesterase [Planctomycetota bacterium]
DWWTHKREYVIAGDKIKAGKSVIAVRVFDNFGGGGFGGQDDYVKISLKDDATKTIPLAGTWKSQIATKLVSLTPPLSAPMGPDHPHSPAGLYNGMIHGITKFPIKGAIWYQGESNASRAQQYYPLLSAMITDWRKQWGVGDFPFLIVQLANYKAAPVEPEESNWAELRDAQTKTANGLKNCGLALAIDIGEEGSIHPVNKQDVGLRLSLAARKIAYGEDIVYSGPTYESMKIADGKAYIKFGNIGGGLEAVGGKLKHFAIAGADKKFVWADAEIDGDTVIVSSPKVPAPVAVRYAWSMNPEGCNLYNKEKLPAVPFRTDDWPGTTDGNY